MSEKELNIKCPKCGTVFESGVEYDELKAWLQQQIDETGESSDEGSTEAEVAAYARVLKWIETKQSF